MSVIVTVQEQTEYHRKLVPSIIHAPLGQEGLAGTGNEVRAASRYLTTLKIHPCRTFILPVLIFADFVDDPADAQNRPLSSSRKKTLENKMPQKFTTVH